MAAVPVGWLCVPLTVVEEAATKMLVGMNIEESVLVLTATMLVGPGEDEGDFVEPAGDVVDN